jgi:formylglycine-generating enzyme required for sulfatase activity
VTRLRLRYLPLLVVMCCLGVTARADESPKSAEGLVRALLDAPRPKLSPIETRLRKLGPAAAPAIRAAREGTSAEGRARLARILARIIEDFHRAHTPPGMDYVPAGELEVPRARSPWGPSGARTEVGAFYLDRTEVTVGAWRAWLGKLAKAERDAVERRGLSVPPEDAAERLPMTRVSYPEAAQYAREARGGRLPTVEEFERATRGSGVKTWPWGDTMRKGFANFHGSGPDAPRPVGSYPRGAGPFGALDLAGNVAEWTSTEVRQGRSGRYRLLFGGSFRQDPDPACTWRGRDRMRARVGPHERLAWVGFRVARDVPVLPE